MFCMAGVFPAPSLTVIFALPALWKCEVQVQGCINNISTPSDPWPTLPDEPHLMTRQNSSLWRIALFTIKDCQDVRESST
jgi:hypothetical protein